MIKMDKKDFQIIELLKKNAKLTSQQINARTGMPVTTIHNRIKKLEREGFIKGYTIKLDHKKLGSEIEAYILVIVDYADLKKKDVSQHELSETIKKMHNVENVSMITGEADIIIKVRLLSIDELDNFVTKQLRNLPGVDKTRTCMVLHNFE